MKINQSPVRLLVAVLGLGASMASQSAVTPEEAAKLKSTLTPIGAEKAGNAAGTIPAWTGTPTPVSKDRPTADLFPQEKPVLEITEANAAQHKDKLSEGTLALLAKYPTYKLQVYPSHRTVTYPQFIYDRTAQNAAKTKLSANSNFIVDFAGGYPFPIPKSGNEVILNHLNRAQPCSAETSFSTVVVGPNGVPVLSSSGKTWTQVPYDCPKVGANPEQITLMSRQLSTAPAYKAGEALLITDKLGDPTVSRAAFQYLVGQRRVRRAPNVGYDTPDFISSGANYFDEIAGFFGGPDRYEWKLVGKQEMYIPYNNNRMFGVPIKELIVKDHLSSSALRWELHRVWVLEATLAPGKRHVVPKRRFYIDEDSWTTALMDGYDASGKLWRVMQVPNMLLPEGGQSIGTTLIYNLQAGTMSAALLFNEGYFRASEPKPEDFFGPDAVAAEAQR